MWLSDKEGDIRRGCMGGGGCLLGWNEGLYGGGVFDWVE